MSSHANQSTSYLPNVFPPASHTYSQVYDNCSVLTRTHQYGDTIAYYSTIIRNGKTQPTFLDTKCTVGRDTIHLRSEVSTNWYQKLIINITIPNPYSPLYSIATFLESPNANPEPQLPP